MNVPVYFPAVAATENLQVESTRGFKPRDFVCSIKELAVLHFVNRIGLGLMFKP